MSAKQYKYRFIFATSILCCLMQHAVYAALPVTISEPSPAIASNYITGATPQTVIYTITNNVRGIRLPLQVSGLAGPLTRTPVDNDCGNTIPAGHATCKIGVVIAPRLSDLGNVNQKLSVNYQGRSAVTRAITFSVVTDPSFFVAVGQNTVANTALIAIGTNVATTWSIRSFANSLLQNKIPQLTGVNCTLPTNSSKAVCIAVGAASSANSCVNYPALVASNDSGNSWLPKTIAGLDLTKQGAFVASNCVNKNQGSLCAAAGYSTDNLNNYSPLLAISSDGATTWTQTATGINSGVYQGLTCIPNGANPICLAVGSNAIVSPTPVINRSTDGGATWQARDLSSLTNTYLNNISCTGIGQNAVCAAVGVNENNNQGVLLMSNNSGASWTQKSFPVPGIAAYNSVSCTGSRLSATCLVVGYYESCGQTYSFAAQSIDAGSNWTVQTLTAYPDSQLNSASCTSLNGGTSFCIGVGQANNQPFMVQLTGQSMNITNHNITGALYNVSCNTQNTNAVCVAVGNKNGTQPLVLLTRNTGDNWSEANADLPTAGYFQGSNSLLGANLNQQNARKKLQELFIKKAVC